jgi:hypothetical protein
MDDNRKLAREVFLALEDSVDSMRIDIDRIAAYGEARYKAGLEKVLGWASVAFYVGPVEDMQYQSGYMHAIHEAERIVARLLEAK